MKTSAPPTLRALRLLFRGLICATKPLPHARERRRALKTIRDIPYVEGGDAAQVLDVIRSRDAHGVQPALLYIHGGGFAICSKETHEIITSNYAAMGFTVFSIEYRLAPEDPYPAAFHDSCDALLWVLKHAADYGGDVSRLVVAGESAGGNLALGVTLAACWRDPNDAHAGAVYDANPSIRAVMPACGLLHVTGIGRQWRDKPQNFIGKYIWRGLERTYLPSLIHFQTPPIWADPLVILETRRLTRPVPPTFVLCGSWDPLHVDSERLSKTLDRLGVDHEYLCEKGAVHAYHALVWTASARRAWERKRRFLAERIPGNQARPTIAEKASAYASSPGLGASTIASTP